MKASWMPTILAAILAPLAIGQKPVAFPLSVGQGQVQADLYGHGARGVVLAHGGRFNKESWKKQAETLANAGFLVLSVRFRGDGLNPDGSPGDFGSDADNAADILAAVSYLHRMGRRRFRPSAAALEAMQSATRMPHPNRGISIASLFWPPQAAIIPRN